MVKPPSKQKSFMMSETHQLPLQLEPFTIRNSRTSEMTINWIRPKQAFRLLHLAKAPLLTAKVLFSSFLLWLAQPFRYSGTSRIATQFSIPRLSQYSSLRMRRAG
jgi:hypothetical protein